MSQRPPSPAMSLSEITSGFDVHTADEEDWKEKYELMKSLLEETQRELEDYQQSSQELETELEADIKRYEDAQEAAQQKIRHIEHDCKEWKKRYRSALDNATRWENEFARVDKQLNATSGRIVNLEMENDDLEQKQRAATAAALYKDEEVEHLLIERDEYKEQVEEKAALEEENHRLRVQVQELTEDLAIIRARPALASPLSLPTPSQSSGGSVDSESNSSFTQPGENTPDTSFSIPVLPPDLSSSTTSKIRLIGLLRLTQSGSISMSNDGRNTPSGVSGRPRSRGLRLLGDMRSRTKALQARLGNTLPRTNGLPASKTGNNIRSRKSLISSISAIRKKQSRQNVKTGDLQSRPSMDTHRPPIEDDRRSVTSLKSDGRGWDSVSDVLGMTTPRAPRLRTKDLKPHDRATKATVRAQYQSTIRPSVFEASDTHPTSTPIHDALKTQFSGSPPTSFRFPSGSGTAFHEHDNDSRPSSRLADSRPSTALDTLPISDGSKLQKLRHKRSTTLGGLGEWGNGLRSSLGAALRAPRPADASAQYTSHQNDGIPPRPLNESMIPTSRKVSRPFNLVMKPPSSMESSRGYPGLKA